MDKCCWYKTDVSNLLHYTKNRIKHLWSREADLTRLVVQIGSRPDAADYADAIGAKPE